MVCTGVGFSFESPKMMIVLLLLGVTVRMGLSHQSYNEEYGKSLYILLRRRSNSIEFIPTFRSEVTILWKQGDPVATADRKRIMMGNNYMMYDLTQKDTGHYIVRDKEQNELYTYSINIKAQKKTFERSPGESLSFTFDLEPSSCNIYFFPESKGGPGETTANIVRRGWLQDGLDKFGCVGFDLIKPCGISNDVLQMSCRGRYEIKDQNGDTALEVSLQMEPKKKTFERSPGESLSFTFDLEPKSCNIYFFPESDGEPARWTTNIVRRGWLQYGLDEFGCVGFDLIKPCGISNNVLQMSCRGRYEIKDQNGDTVLEVSLQMEPLPYEPSVIGISVGVFLSSLFCCCVRRCCRKSASKEDRTESEAADPDVQHQEYNVEPVRLRPDQLSDPSGTHYPAQPRYTPTDPLIHNHPTVDVPPSYSEVSAPAEHAYTPPPPIHSDPEPRFELTFPSAPPLNSDSTICDVYTSGKLNL